jgi:AcrR family transcriptional regulator
MASPEPSTGELGETPLSATQDRILSAALELFGEHGVNGTSYQMVADALGVTKAAIYHQFKTKDDIVIAVTERELSKLGDALAAAEAEKSHTKARELLLSAVVDHAVEHRRAASTLQFDPVIVRLLAAHKPFQLFVERLYRALIGDDTGPEARLDVAILSSTIGGTVVHPLAADIDEETLRARLLHTARRILGLSG